MLVTRQNRVYQATALTPMLSVLKIRNLALVDSLTWEIGSGLVCVTGETGAGKSVIVGAVKMVLGERADRGLVRTGETTCTVEALFELGDATAVNALLEEAGVNPCDDGGLVIRRTVAAAGSGNKQFVNGSPCTLAILKSIGHHLVDLHGPHDHHSLLSKERQLVMLDAYAGAQKQRDTYTETYRGWTRLQAEYDDLLSAERTGAQELDLLRFQVEEIESADLKVGEEEEAEARYKVAANSRRLVEETNAALGTLSGLTEQLGELRRHTNALNKTDPDTEKFTAGAETATVELQELETNLGNYLSSLETDPAEAARLEARLDTIHTLKRKYGNTVADVLAHLGTAAAKLEKTENRGAELERLEAAAAAALEKTIACGKKLGAARQKAAPKLAAVISSHLGELGFKRSQFEVSLKEHPDGQPDAGGLEECDFLFAPNPGEPPTPLRQ